MRPGSAPTYVRRWPRISASSRTPPSDDPDELAAERPRDRLAEAGLADAGRAAEREHRAGATPADDLQVAGGAAVADGQVLQDAVLHVGQAGVVGVEHLAGRAEVGVVLGAGRPRHLEHGVEPGADPAGLGRRVAGALELADLAQRGLAYVVRAARPPRRGCGSRPSRRARPRRAPCGSRRAAGAAGTRAATSPDPRGRRSLIRSVTSCSARWSRTQPTSSSRRAVTSAAPRSSTFCSSVSQGA